MFKHHQKLIKELPSLVPGDDGRPTRRRRFSTGDSTISSSEAAPDEQPDHGGRSPVVGEQQDHGTHTGETDPQQQQQTVVVSASLPSSNSKEELGRNPGEIAFFKLLHAEFKKASHFFEKAQQEFSIREERVREGMEIMKRPNSIMVNEKWSMLAKSIYRLYKDLLLLETFAIMTYCSFSKILKKHDKVTGHQTRAPFMANVVGKANFTNYPKVLEMISRCESLYEEVSDRLLQEGKEGLCEDERLFINMISRLNEQALDNPDAPERAEGRRAGGLGTAASSSTTIASTGAESEAVSRLRSLVEENDMRNTAHVSEGQAEDDPANDNTNNNDKKRSASAMEDCKPKAIVTKRPKV